jgi:hypothetical protein
MPALPVTDRFALPCQYTTTHTLPYVQTPSTVTGNEDEQTVLVLAGTDRDGVLCGATVNPPTAGQLFQTTDGVTLGAEITAQAPVTGAPLEYLLVN